MICPCASTFSGRRPGPAFSLCEVKELAGIGGDQKGSAVEIGFPPEPLTFVVEVDEIPFRCGKMLPADKDHLRSVEDKGLLAFRAFTDCPNSLHG